MRVIPLKTLEDALEGGTMPSLNCMDSAIDVTEIPEKSRVLLVSHRWWSSVRAEPDQVSAGWPKVRSILTKMIPAFMKSNNCTKDDIYIWWDFVSICQVDGPLKQSQIACIPIFVAISDAVVACHAGDEDYHADGGPQVYDRSKKARVPYTGNTSFHPGHYNNRVWTMCELFISTSTFQRQIRGEEMPVYTVGLDANYDIVSGPKDQNKKLRSEFHETHGWSMPPRENLIDKRDLEMLEPLIVMLAGESMPRIVRAGKFGLCIALEELLAAGDDANASDPSNGETALHAAARGQHEAMIERLLSCPGIVVNIQNEAGQAPLHLIVASGMFDPRHRPEKQKRCIEQLLNAGADKLLEDDRARTAVDTAVARYGEPWANHLFPGSEERVRRSSTAPVLEMNSPSFEEAGHIFKATRRFESGNSIRWRSLKGKGDKASDGLDGQLLVCFASGIASGWMYIEWAHRMIEETGLEVILVDPPGNGHSEIRMSGVRSPFDLEGDLEGCSTTEDMMELYCKDLVVVIREQGWCDQGMHLVGTSFGSLISAYLALTYPDWVKSLTLFGWLHSIRHTPEVKDNLKGLVVNLVSLFNDGRLEELETALGGFLSKTTSKPLQEIFFQACRPGGDVYQGSGGMNMLTMLVYALLKNLLPLSRLCMPVLVVQGEADAMFMDHALELKKVIPQCQLRILPHVCHIPPVENPVGACMLVVDFLRAHCKHDGSKLYASMNNMKEGDLAQASDEESLQ
ncbi:unnamed protein product [Polarella glacialis]|nr:unnamed protein product [Polarella glacialis]